MWCPSCGAEYRPGFTRCPDCDVDLVSEPPPEPEPAAVGRTPVMLGVEYLGPDPAIVFVGSPPEADLIRSVLAGSGIDCVIWRSGLEQSYGGIAPNQVVVRREDAERAGEIIAAASTGELDLDAPDDDPRDWITPADGSAATAPSSDPIADVPPWWRHPELPALLSAVRVLFGIAIVVGLAYLGLTLITD